MRQKGLQSSFKGAYLCFVNGDVVIVGWSVGKSFRVDAATTPTCSILPVDSRLSADEDISSLQRAHEVSRGSSREDPGSITFQLALPMIWPRSGGTRSTPSRLSMAGYGHGSRPRRQRTEW